MRMPNFYGRKVAFPAVLMSLLALCACATDIKPVPAPSTAATSSIIGAVSGGVLGSVTVVGGPLGAWFGGLAGAVYGHNLQKQISLLKQIQDNRVQVFAVGDHLTLILPADQFFTQNAPSFNTYSFRTLDMIIRFLNDYPKLSVKVSGYTDNQGTPDRNLALSKARAELISKYLWAHGLDTRMLYAVGYGDCDSVASNATASGRAANRRVEISLYKLASRSS